MQNVSSKASILWGMVAFVIAFLIQMIFVFKWNYFRYSYEEFQTMAMAAHYAGYSWDRLTSSAPYGGIPFILVYRQLFKLGISGTAVYRVMRWGMAILMAIPAYLTVRIAVKGFKVSPYLSVLLGITSTLAESVRASSIRSENMLALFTWILIYAILFNNYSKRKIARIIYSALAGGSVVCMILSNVRALLIIPALLFVFIIYKFKNKKWLVKPVVFGTSFSVFSILGGLLYQHVLTTYSCGQTWETSLFAPFSSFFVNILRGVQRLHMSYGVRGWFDIFVSNIWMISIFTCGIVIYGAVSSYREINNKKSDSSVEQYSVLILVIATILSLWALAFSSIQTAIYAHSREKSINGQFFSLGYYGYLISPVLIIEILILLKKGKDKLQDLKYSLVIIASSGAYLIVSVMMPLLKNGHAEMKWWFGYETSFLVMLNQWADKDTGIWFYIIPTMIVLFLMWTYHKSNDYKTVVSLVCLVSIVSYSYIEWDWANKTTYRDSYNAFIDYVNVGVLSNSGIKDVYFDGERDAAYAFQLAMPALTIRIDVPDKYDKNVVILSSDDPHSVAQKYNLNSSYRVALVDENEILITNNQYIIGILDEAIGTFGIYDCSGEFVNYVYNSILGRGADPVGLNGWASDIRENRLQPSDLILLTFQSDEFKSRGLDDEQIAATIISTFTGVSGSKEQIHHIALRLADGETIADIAQEFIDSEEYYRVLSSYGLRDDNSNRINGYISRLYDIILRRPADGYGSNGFAEMIRSGEVTLGELVSITISSAEYASAGHSTADTVIILHIFFTDTFPSMEVVEREASMIDSGEMTFEELEEQLAGTVAYHNMIMDYNIGEYT